MRDLEGIEGLTGLITLHLSHNSITTLPEGILKIPNLKRLSIGRNPLDGVAIRVLEKLREKRVQVNVREY
ncbi:MAG: leucine-rich repeat domain-containing protein [Candidatus Helarchaeota archaeon]|nr:leucine-rich repeat domain-containing protein [Candidatus Helarchaeota archaeon]